MTNKKIITFILALSVITVTSFIMYDEYIERNTITPSQIDTLEERNDVIDEIGNNVILIGKVIQFQSGHNKIVLHDIDENGSVILSNSGSYLKNHIQLGDMIKVNVYIENNRIYEKSDNIIADFGDIIECDKNGNPEEEKDLYDSDDEIREHLGFHLFTDYNTLTVTPNSTFTFNVTIYSEIYDMDVNFGAHGNIYIDSNGYHHDTTTHLPHGCSWDTFSIYKEKTITCTVNIGTEYGMNDIFIKLEHRHEHNGEDSIMLDYMIIEVEVM